MAQTRMRRAQVVLPEEEYNLLREYAAENKQSVSLLIRQTVHKFLLADLERRRKEQALARLVAGNTPVQDWPEMEKDLAKMWEEPPGA